MWEMLTGKLPFNGMGRTEYMSQVVGLGCRPTLPKDLPDELAALLQVKLSTWATQSMLNPWIAY